MDLFLEPHLVSASHSNITDSLMLRIKSTSSEQIAGQISSNSFGKVNKKFCRYVIDMLAVQLVFDNWHPFAGQNAPSPYVKETDSEVICHIKHNQDVLLSFCLKFNPLNAVAVFKEKTLGWEVPSLKTLFSTGVTYKHKLEKGIISSWKNYAENHVSTIVQFERTNLWYELNIRFSYAFLSYSLCEGMHVDSSLGYSPDDQSLVQCLSRH